MTKTFWITFTWSPIFQAEAAKYARETFEYTRDEPTTPPCFRTSEKPPNCNWNEWQFFCVAYPNHSMRYCHDSHDYQDVLCSVERIPAFQESQIRGKSATESSSEQKLRCRCRFPTGACLYHHRGKIIPQPLLPAWREHALVGKRRNHPMGRFE